MASGRGAVAAEARGDYNYKIKHDVRKMEQAGLPRFKRWPG